MKVKKQIIVKMKKKSGEGGGDQVRPGMGARGVGVGRAAGGWLLAMLGGKG